MVSVQAGSLVETLNQYTRAESQGDVHHLYSSSFSSTSVADTDVFCWKDSFGRGAGTVPNKCPDDKPDKDAGLCYKDCPDKYKGVGPVCWKGLKAKGRGAGVVPSKCADGYEKDTGLCYKDCKATFYGVGPVCWKKCSGFTPIACGAGCASSGAACITKVFDMTNAVVSMMVDLTSLFSSGGITSALLDATAQQVTETVALQAAYDAAYLFKSEGYSRTSYINYMNSGASKLGTSLVQATLIGLWNKADTAGKITLTAEIISTFDPTGIADVVVAFANSSC
jgi:hypothetical protein